MSLNNSHSFPYRTRLDENLQWKLAIETHQEIGASQLEARILICELHFDSHLITKRKDRNILQTNAIPNIFPGIPLEYVFSCFISFDSV